MMSAMIFYVVAMSEGPDGGIYRYELTPEKTLRELSFTPLPRANYLCFSPDRKYLYSTCGVDGVGGVAAFAVGKNGELTFLNQASAKGKSTCHVETSPDGKFLFAPNYSTGSVAVFSLRDGKIDQMVEFVQHVGSGPNRKRQEAAHPHFNRITPDGKYLTVIDLGMDELLSYPLDGKNGIDKTRPVISKIVPGGSGPRHLVFTGDGKTAYLLNEMGNSVMVTDYHDGKYTIRQTISTLPENFQGETKAAAIRFSRDRKFLFASNRGYDSIASFRVGPDGLLTRHEIVPSQGESPRDFDFLPDPAVMLVTNEFTDNMVLFSYDPVAGTLKSGASKAIKHPLCVLNFKE